DVAAHDHAEVAVHGVDGVHEKRGRSDGAERGGDLARDEAALPQAGNAHAATTAVYQLEGAIEGGGHGSGDTVGQGTQGLGFDADHVFAGVLHGKEDVIKK